MKKAANDNADTWTHISVAAERVLTQIEKKEEFVAGVEQRTQRGNEAGDDHCERTGHASIVINKRQSA